MILEVSVEQVICSTDHTHSADLKEKHKSLDQHYLIVPKNGWVRERAGIWAGHLYFVISHSEY